MVLYYERFGGGGGVMFAENEEFLRQKLAYFFGGRDNDGRLILIIPSKATWSSIDMERTLRIFQSALSEKDHSNGVTVLVDARLAHLSTSRLIHTLAYTMSAVQRIVFIRNKTTIRDKIRRKKYNIKISTVLMAKIREEFTELPIELSGDVFYNHTEWLQNRIEAERFLSQLQKSIESEQQPSEEAIEEHIEYGNYIISLLHPNIDAALTQTIASKLSLITNKHKRIMSKSLSDLRASELDQDIDALCTWFETDSQQLLYGNMKVGYTLFDAEKLRHEHEQIELSCMPCYARYNRICDIMKENPTLVSSSAADNLKYLESLVRTFAQQAEKKRTLLITANRFYQFFDDFRELTTEMGNNLNDGEVAFMMTVKKAMEVGEKCLEEGYRLLEQLSLPFRALDGEPIQISFTSILTHVEQIMNGVTLRFKDMQEYFKQGNDRQTNQKRLKKIETEIDRQLNSLENLRSKNAEWPKVFKKVRKSLSKLIDASQNVRKSLGYETEITVKSLSRFNSLKKDSVTAKNDRKEIDEFTNEIENMRQEIITLVYRLRKLAHAEKGFGESVEGLQMEYERCNEAWQVIGQYTVEFMNQLHQDADVSELEVKILELNDEVKKMQTYWKDIQINQVQTTINSILSSVSPLPQRRSSFRRSLSRDFKAPEPNKSNEIVGRRNSLNRANRTDPVVWDTTADIPDYSSITTTASEGNDEMFNDVSSISTSSLRSNSLNPPFYPHFMPQGHSPIYEPFMTRELPIATVSSSESSSASYVSAISPNRHKLSVNTSLPVKADDESTPSFTTVSDNPPSTSSNNFKPDSNLDENEREEEPEIDDGGAAAVAPIDDQLSNSAVFRYFAHEEAHLSDISDEEDFVSAEKPPTGKPKQSESEAVAIPESLPNHTVYAEQLKESIVDSATSESDEDSMTKSSTRENSMGSEGQQSSSIEAVSESATSDLMQASPLCSSENSDDDEAITLISEQESHVSADCDHLTESSSSSSGIVVKTTTDAVDNEAEVNEGAPPAHSMPDASPVHDFAFSPHSPPSPPPSSAVSGANITLVSLPPASVYVKVLDLEGRVQPLVTYDDAWRNLAAANDDDAHPIDNHVDLKIDRDYETPAKLEKLFRDAEDEDLEDLNVAEEAEEGNASDEESQGDVKASEYENAVHNDEADVNVARCVDEFLSEPHCDAMETQNRYSETKIDIPTPDAEFEPQSCINGGDSHVIELDPSPRSEHSFHSSDFFLLDEESGGSGSRSIRASDISSAVEFEANLDEFYEDESDSEDETFLNAIIGQNGGNERDPDGDADRLFNIANLDENKEAEEPTVIVEDFSTEQPPVELLQPKLGLITDQMLPAFDSLSNLSQSETGSSERYFSAQSDLYYSAASELSSDDGTLVCEKENITPRRSRSLSPTHCITAENLTRIDRIRSEERIEAFLSFQTQSTCEDELDDETEDALNDSASTVVLRTALQDTSEANNLPDVVNDSLGAKQKPADGENDLYHLLNERNAAASSYIKECRRLISRSVNDLTSDTDEEDDAFGAIDWLNIEKTPTASIEQLIGSRNLVTQRWLALAYHITELIELQQQPKTDL